MEGQRTKPKKYNPVLLMRKALTKDDNAKLDKICMDLNIERQFVAQKAVRLFIDQLLAMPPEKQVEIIKNLR